LLSVSGTVARGRTAAPIRAAAALRWWSLGSAGRRYVEQQWSAWVNLDIGEMTPSLGALLKQIEKRGGVGGSSEQLDRAARAWVAFDPSRRTLSRLHMTDISAVTSEMRDVMNAALEAAGNTP
jgi:hypothetical protein